MTRENKLALVVGFGLILVVGILISDHLSEARAKEPASLTQVVDPLAPSRLERPDLIAVRAATSEGRSGVPGGLAAVEAPRPTGDGHPGPVRPAPPRPVDAIEMGRAAPATIGPTAAEAEDLPYTYHEVRPGESLTTICRERYGDPSLALEVARSNDLDDPDLLHAGMRLRLPAAEALVRGATAPPPARRVAPPRAPRTYTVKEGDVLTEIALRLLGSSRRHLAIFELNRDVLARPDALVPGMTLRIPRDAG